MAFIPPSSGSGPSGPSGPSFPRPRPARGAFPPPSKDEHRINERIRVPQVRLIDENGEQLGIVQTFEALRIARDRGLDLMEISPNAQPPVCKICDYGKFKYEKKKKEHEARKKQTVIKVKEIQLRPRTDQHDLDYKFKNIRTFLEEGDKAKITMMFRGREVTYVEQGHKMMRELAKLVEDIAVIEAPAKLEGKKLIMILAPNPAAKKAQKPKPQAPAATPNGGAPASGKDSENG
ncbi:MAG: translation initiation factor IF-3 [Oligoflexia bacterium]